MCGNEKSEQEVRMHTRLFYSLLGFYISVVVSEQTYAQQEEKKDNDQTVQEATTGTPVQEYLKNHDTIMGEDISDQTRLFYKQNSNVAVWYPNGEMSKAAEVALEILKNADEEGLDPADYKIEKVDYSQSDWIEHEVLLTQTMLKYINDVRVGRVDPTHVARFIKVVSPPTRPVELLTEALKDSDHFHLLREMGPDIEDYQNLKKLLKKYRELYRKYPSMPEIKIKGKVKKIKVGSSDPSIPNLKKILHILGYLKSYTTNSLYDVQTEKALKTFQDYHNLEIDGYLGEQTVKTLNWSLEKQIQKIIVNMERLRWLPDHLGNRFIMVNVGGYEVLAVHDGKVEHRIKAIVGQTSRQTPLFYATLKNIIVNPSWGVPHSILVRDKLRRIINDPGYLAKAGFTVYDHSGRRMDPYSVNWESEGGSMHLRQSPGAHNALGRLKFNIENPYTVYLHGTPLDKLFKKQTRNFSSGCIRLEKPTVLAAWVLKDVNGWDVDDIAGKIKQGRTRTVPIPVNLPVYFTYMTVWVDNNDPTKQAHFSPDAYKLDATLIEELGVKA